MTSALRDSGIKVLGRVPWGTHFCQFYQTPKDLREILVSYFRAGLASNEKCFWVCSEPLGVDKAKAALKRVVPGLDRKLREGQIEIIPHTDWYLKNGRFSSRRVLKAWVDKLSEARKSGYEGLRLSENTFWLEKKDWGAFREYEEAVDGVISRYPMIALCTYSLDRCDAQEVFDVLENHEQALVRRTGKWSLVSRAAILRAQEDARTMTRLRQEIGARREREEKLREQAALLDLARDAITVRDPAFRITFWNDGAQEIYGWSQQEALGQIAHVMMKTRFPVSFEESRRHLFERGHWEGEITRTRKDGETVVVETRLAVLRGQDNKKPVAILEISRDVTERRRIETALKSASTYTRGLIEASLDPLVTISPEGKITDVNHATELVTGVARKRLIGTDFSTYFTEPAMAQAGYQEVFRKGEVRDYPLAIRHASGAVTEVLYNATVYKDPKGQVAGVFAAARDVTELRAAERDRLRLATAIEQLADGIAIMDLDGRILSANPAFGDHHAPPPLKVVGQPLQEILQIDRADTEIARQLGRAIALGRTWNWRVARRTPAGQVREIELSVSPIRDGEGRLTHSIAVSRDVTQELQLEERIRQWQKMEALGTLAGGIAHDFNNILLPILINTELVLGEGSPESPTSRRLSQVLEAGRRGKDMVRQIIAFSQQKEQDRKPVEVVPIVKEALKLLRISLAKNIEIVERIGTGSPVIVADPTQIQQIVLNLGNNAAYAMRDKGGPLEVSLADMAVDAAMATHFVDIKPGAYVRLAVADSGQGIPPEIMSRIFEPFFTTKKQGEGTGMGLAVVHGIVKSHNGAISVKSEIGRGTEFAVYLPRVFGDATKIEERREPYARGTERILFVDDEDLQVRAMTRLLEHLGYRATGRTDPLEALDLFKRDPAAFDLAIMDQTMPRLTGGELAREILKVQPGFPVILCSGYSETLDEPQALAMGIRAFIMKPFSVREISRRIRQVLATQD
ncbi:MAG TPA: PAS domain S-box protein [Acidobacteriota bacterium]|nr:PAS domain S-box protein [Acidobacteriota bacterium]